MTKEEESVGLTRTISVFYILFFGSLLVATIMGLNIMGYQLDFYKDAWFLILALIISLGVFRKTKWGRWLAYPLSAFLLAGVPIGTLFGGFMIYHLTKYRRKFNNWI